MSETVIERDRSLVVVVERREHTAHDLVERMIGITVQNHAVVHRHSAVGDRSRFVKTKHVDPCKHFEGIQILYEGLFFCKPSHAQRHGERRQKQQSRRDHADHDRTRQLNGFGDILIHGAEVDPEHACGDERDQTRDHADKQANGVHDLRTRFFVLFRFGGQAVQIGRFADFIHPHAACAAGNERTGVQRFAFRFFDGNGFARQEGFVHFHDAVGKFAVGGDLLSRFEQNDVVYQNFTYGNFLFYAAAHDLCRCRDQNG